VSCSSPFAGVAFVGVCLCISSEGFFDFDEFFSFVFFVLDDVGANVSGFSRMKCLYVSSSLLRLVDQ
jgi:hypothetical protein